MIIFHLYLNQGIESYLLLIWYTVTHDIAVVFAILYRMCEDIEHIKIFYFRCLSPKYFYSVLVTLTVILLIKHQDRSLKERVKTEHKEGSGSVLLLFYL